MKKVYVPVKTINQYVPMWQYTISLMSSAYLNFGSVNMIKHFCCKLMWKQLQLCDGLSYAHTFLYTQFYTWSSHDLYVVDGKYKIAEFCFSLPFFKIYIFLQKGLYICFLHFSSKIIFSKIKFPVFSISFSIHLYGFNIPYYSLMALLSQLSHVLLLSSLS